jgi:hypothetical protein
VLDSFESTQSVVEDGRKNGHITSLRSAGKCNLSAPGDNRARPQKGDKEVLSRKNCGQLPAHLSPSADRSRKGVPLPIPSPVLTAFVYLSSRAQNLV